MHSVQCTFHRVNFPINHRAPPEEQNLTKAPEAAVAPGPTLQQIDAAIGNPQAVVDMVSQLQAPPGMPQLPPLPVDNRFVRPGSDATGRTAAEAKPAFPSLQELEQMAAIAYGRDPLPGTGVAAPPIAGASVSPIPAQPVVPASAPPPPSIPEWAQQIIQQNAETMKLFADLQQRTQAAEQPVHRQLTAQEEYQQIASELRAQNLPVTAETLVAARAHRSMTQAQAQWDARFQQLERFQQDLIAQAQEVQSGAFIDQRLALDTAQYGARIPQATKSAMAEQARLYNRMGYSPEDSVRAALAGYTHLLAMLPPSAQPIVGPMPGAANMQPQPQPVPAHLQTNPAAFSQQQQAMLAAATSGQGAGRHQEQIPTLEQLESLWLGGRPSGRARG